MEARARIDCCSEGGLHLNNMRLDAKVKTSSFLTSLRHFLFARPPSFPPLRAGALFVFFPHPDPERFLPPDILFTVAQARDLAVLALTPRDS